MAFGPIMRLPVDGLTIELAPLTQECMPQFVENGGMQMHTVSRYLGRRTAPTREDEQEWYDKIRQDEQSFAWGIWVVDGSQRTVIGTSALRDQQDWTLNIWTSGSMIFRPEYWGRGIGTRCHMARTWFAFQRLRANVIRSSAVHANSRSVNALLKCGYARSGLVRNGVFVDGKYFHEVKLECINPDPTTWREWWHGDHVPKVFREARHRTFDTLTWADEHVSLL